MSNVVETILEGAADAVQEVAPLLGLPAPVTAVAVLVKDALDVEHAITAQGVQRREQASGASAYRESKFVGLREAIIKIEGMYANTSIPPDSLEAILRAARAHS